MSTQFDWHFWIDVGGTFTDVVSIGPNGVELRGKSLSSATTKGTWPLTGDVNGFSDSARAASVSGFWIGFELRIIDARGEVLDTIRIADFDFFQARFTFDKPIAKATLRAAKTYELVSPEPSPLFAVRSLLQLRLDQPLPRMAMYLGTTRGTNALLTRRGAPTALVTTRGFGDLLHIGEQDRPRLFDLTIRKPHPLCSFSVEIDERIAADGTVLRPVDLPDARNRLMRLREGGVHSLAICFMHGFRFPIHEQAVEILARELGFDEISVSHRVSPLIKMVPRAETTVLDAYLNPVIRLYADQIVNGMSDGSRLQLMSSSGGLVSRERFTGKESVLSGPAGGVVGFARAAEQAGWQRAIGFDMGGTSTDVARYDGHFEREFETRKAGVRIITPIMAIETVAAGGGSICGFSGGRLTVGPASAGADPGPACYGRGGPLAVTDLNVFLGRMSASQFPFRLDLAAIESRLDALVETVSQETGDWMTRIQIAAGLVAIANHNMAAAIRTVSVASGYDPREYLLVAFGGAGPQHAIAVAAELGIDTILVHPQGSVLSAVGIRLADQTTYHSQAILQTVKSEITEAVKQALYIDAVFESLTDAARKDLQSENPLSKPIQIVKSLDLRFLGTEPYLNIDMPDDADFSREFVRQHRRLYGYVQNRPIEVVAARVQATISGERLTRTKPNGKTQIATTTKQIELYSGGSLTKGAEFDWANLGAGDIVIGPAVIADPMTTTVVDVGWRATVLAAGQLILERTSGDRFSLHGTPNLKDNSSSVPVVADPIELEIFSNCFIAIAKQMGITLQRTSVSVNIKDRLDFSCALFASNGDLVVNAPHIPVHLGAMSETVRAVIRNNTEVNDGDVFVTNDPYQGGSHLPDVTVVTPVFVPSDKEAAFWVASRGHHAEIGGRTPGSMPPDATCLADEGVLIRNVLVIAAGRENFGELEELLAAPPYPSRNVADNLADIRAQIAANRIGANELLALVERHSLEKVTAYMGFVQDAAERQVRAALQAIPDGTYTFSDEMDSGAKICVKIEKSNDRIKLDFAGTSPQTQDNLNANRAIVMAATMYVMRCLLESELPLNQGVMRPVEIDLPPCFLNPTPGPTPATSPAIVGGNVETSQRIVDVLLGALGLAAASQGTMNNWLMGDASFGYYETIGGGSGATVAGQGADAVHTHMSNTRLTDPEVLETRCPVRLVECRIRNGSGGAGKNRGGNGMVRTVEFLRPLTVSLLTSRRNRQPYGLYGGKSGLSGVNRLTRRDGTVENLPSRVQVDAQPGDRLTIETPGGGGWGTASESSEG